MQKRIILKLSGEALAPEKQDRCCECEKVNCTECKIKNAKSASLDPARVDEVAKTLVELNQMGVQLGVVIGGGNIWRGRFTDEMSAVNADQMGMLATIINALCVQDAVTRQGAKAKVFAAQEMTRFADLYTAARAEEALENGYIVLLAGGSGNPFFTTDTAAALRAAELHADAVYKGTTTEGVLSYDPRERDKHDAPPELIKNISFKEARERNLKVMDIIAYQIAEEQKIPEFRIFAMKDLRNIIRVASGEDVGTTVHQ